MIRTIRPLAFGLFLAAVLLASPADALAVSASNPGRVYAMTNDAAGNGVAVYDRDPQGTLRFVGTVPTGGLGTGADLGSQGALVLTDDGRWLLAVDAGSDELSVLRVTSSGVAASDRVNSGGETPLSVAVDEDVVYVLHGGAPNFLQGFRLTDEGTLEVIAGSARRLSAPDTSPAQAEFSPDGSVLVVTEKATSRIDLFDLGFDGRLSNFRALPSAGITPFGFAFERDRLVVSEAFAGAADASAVSSYELTSSGGLATISASVPTTETAACWVALAGRYAYCTNTGSDTITGYAFGPHGELRRLDPDGVTATTGDNPVDLATSRNGRFVYALNSHEGTISMFERGGDGSLESLGAPVGGLPPFGAAGLAGR